MYSWSQRAAKSLINCCWKGNLCVKCLLQNSWICTADLWEVVVGHKPAILMPVGFPRGLFCLQTSLSLTPVSSLEHGFQADHAKIVRYKC